MSLLDIQDEIVFRLRELPQDVYDDGVPDETKLKFSPDGIMLPYLIVEHSGVTSNPTGVPITGIKGASGRSAVTILCVGPTQRSSRQVSAMIREKLVGFKPTTAGELVPSMAPFSYLDGSARPIRYVTELTFDFITNDVW